MKKNKRIVMMASIILVITAVVSGTLAWLYTNTESVVNTFTPANVDTVVIEDITTTTGVKQAVRIQNIGNTQAYVAARFIVSWQDGQGNMMVAKEGSDYIIEMADNLTSNWIQGSDGTYYHKTPIEAFDDDTAKTDNDLTAVLVKSVKLKDNAVVPTGYKLTVEVMSSGIQSTPVSTVTSNWPVTITGATITGVK